MKTVVVNNSQTGFTEQYARWIAEAAEADRYPLTDAPKRDLRAYDAMVLGSGVHTGSVCKIEWLKEHRAIFDGKRLTGFCVGGNPSESPEHPDVLVTGRHELRADASRLQNPDVGVSEADRRKNAENG